MAPRPAHVHPSGLSPAEHETYSAWIDELDSHISKLGRGLRFGELVAFIRMRTPVDREAEVMSFFGSVPQQQSLGIGEFIAILRLLAHARTCTTLTRDHIFIQTHPVVFTTLANNTLNPFLRDSNQSSSFGRLEDYRDVNLREAAARKKRILPPTALSLPNPNQKSSNSPVTPKASSTNPFRMQPTPESPAQHSKEPAQSESKTRVSSLADATARSPPLPPRPRALPKQPPPKHISQLYQKLDDGTQTPSHIKPLHVPALGPTSLDVISSSLQHSTGANKAFSAGRQAARLPARTGQPSSVNNRKAGENAVRLLGSSHIGVDSQPLRAEPSAQHSSSSEDLYLHKNQSDSSLSSLGGILPRARSVTQSSSATSTAVSATSRNLRKFVHAEKDGHDTMYDTTVPDATGNEEGQTILKGLPVSRITQPTLPPPRRQSNSLTQPESSTSRASKILFGSTPLTGHPGPYSATNVRSSPTKQRTNSLPHISHSRAVSVAGSTASQPSLGPRHLHKGPQGLTRAASVSYKHMQLDTLFLKGRDASQEWLDKARAGRQGAQREERQGLITADEVAITAEVADEDGHESDISDSGNVGSISRQDRWGELERKRTEEEAGWTRLD